MYDFVTEALFPKLLFRVLIHSISWMGKRSNKQKCSLCSGDITFTYKPMEQWKISGTLCGTCYGRKLADHYFSSPDELAKRKL